MKPLTFAAFGAIFAVTGNGPGLPRLAVFKDKGQHNVYEAMARQKRRVLAGDAAAIQRMVGAWKVAQKGIQVRLDAVTAQIAAAQASGLEVSPAWLYQQDRWAAFVKETQTRIDQYAQGASKTAAGMQKAGFAQGSKHAAQLVGTAGVRTGFKMLPSSAFESMVGALTDKSPLHDLFAALGPSAVQKAREIFAVGIAAGDHPRAIAKRFQDELTLTKRRSVLIARTESARAYTTAQKANYEANSDVVMASRWVSSRDSRTCPLCWAKDGTIIPHGEAVGFHPGCRCTLAPVVKYLDTPRKTGEEELAEREAAQPGYAKTILGPSRYDLWKSGQIALVDVVQDVDHPRWGRGVRAKTLKQIDAEIASGAAGVKLPPIKGYVAGAVPAVDLMAGSVPSPPLGIQAATAPQTVADLAAATVQPNPKATATDYTKVLVKKDGATLTPDQLAAVVKIHFPKSTATADTVLHHYAAAGVEPVGGFPQGFVYAPVTKAPPKPKAQTVAIPPPPVVAPSVADVILGPKRSAPNANGFYYDQQTGGKGGSNPGGFFMGSDGVQRYVKFYDQPGQGYGEHLANEVYRLLGLNAPKSTLFQHEGKLAYASELLPIEGTVGQKGLTKPVAKEILNGFAADLLTANWDAVGQGLDNVVILAGGGIARIDNGAAFLYRAQGGLKPEFVLNDLPEWFGFAPGGKNPDYEQVFVAAGYTSPEDIGKGLLKQIDAVAALRTKLGGWESYVKATTPGLDPFQQQKIADAMDARTDLLDAKAQAIRAALAAPKPKAGTTGAKGFREKKTSGEANAMRTKDLKPLWTTFDADEKRGVQEYKGSTYTPMNEHMRGKMSHPSVVPFIEAVKSAFRKVKKGIPSDTMLFRGLKHHPLWHSYTDANVGETIIDTAFLSTAALESFSEDWITGYDQAVLLRIRTPKGVKALPAHGGDYDSEHEYILHGGAWTVVGVSKRTKYGKTYTVLDVEMRGSYEGGAKWEGNWKDQ